MVLGTSFRKKVTRNCSMEQLASGDSDTQEPREPQEQQEEHCLGCQDSVWDYERETAVDRIK